MYALPNYNEIDPTPLLAPFYSFSLYDGCDSRYGLLLYGYSLCTRVFNLTEEEKDTIRFFYYHSIFTILWGLIYGSFFSFTLPIQILDSATQYNQVLIISIVFGIIHIYFGLGVNGYMSLRDGRPLDALFDVGFWYMALTGGIILLLSAATSLIPEGVATVSKYVMIVGMVGIVLTGGRSSSNIGGRLAGGLYELYGISSYVGDFVSYSRLMALGLSGGFIASYK